MLWNYGKDKIHCFVDGKSLCGNDTRSNMRVETQADIIGSLIYTEKFEDYDGNLVSSMDGELCSECIHKAMEQELLKIYLKKDNKVLTFIPNGVSVEVKPYNNTSFIGHLENDDVELHLFIKVKDFKIIDARLVDFNSKNAVILDAVQSYPF